MTSTFTEYQHIARNLSNVLARKASESTIKRDIQYFRDNIGSVKTIDDFMKNNRLYTFAMKAYGLDEMTYAKAFMKKVLTREADSKGNVLVERLQDSRYQDLAIAFNFSNSGANFNSNVSAYSTTIDNYVRQNLETDAGADDEGVRLALYFQRKAGTIKSAYSILADKALAEVVRTALGIPAEAARGSIDAQANLIKRKLDIAGLQDPDKLNTFLKRFTIMWDTQNNAPSTPALALFSGSDAGLSPDILLKLQSIRLGGR
ncbi:DUF1217 domain-containing protein [Methylobacterium sp. J-072]|uniref:DUF1217 domain-containing protein n=1 Tax=Methylobacterium sp. J-072 TaxID=2836651 RepID=UPI001FBACE76|nr:DUF1217 domain-containing protein [Methylobacterium sp. J-072]MCJ2090931.1 DUF1217 domain-containing protein [Methylobacterium sp. J-072]